MFVASHLAYIGLTIGAIFKILRQQRAAKSVTNKSMMSVPVSKKARTISSLSLSGNPICKLVEPGNCQFNEDWTSCKLVERVEVSSTTSLLRFDLPDKEAPLNLSTCACILSKAELPNQDGDNEDVIRPYTPVSTNELVGHFDLLVKVSCRFYPSASSDNHCMFRYYQ